MTGIVLAGIGIGILGVTQLTSWLIISYGWRNAFVILGIIVLVVIVSAAQLMRRSPQGRGLLPDGDSRVEPEGSHLSVRVFSLGEALRTRQLWMLWAIFICLGLSIFSIMLHIVIHATGIGIPTGSAVSILSFVGVLNIAGRVMMGSASDRISNRRVLIIGFSIMLAALVWLQFSQELWMLYLFGAIFGFAYGASLVAESPITAELFGLSEHGVLFGIVDSGFTVGAAIGPVITGYVFDVTGSYQLAFLVITGVTMAGLLLTLLLKPVAGKRA